VENIALLNQLLERRDERPPVSAIFPVILGAEQSAVDSAADLENDGFFVSAIRYPSLAPIRHDCESPSPPGIPKNNSVPWHVQINQWLSKSAQESDGAG
jgi:hypothetical protein